MEKRFWDIRGFDGMKTVFEIRIAVGQITQNQMRDLLRALTAKAGLSYQEIVGAYATRRTKIANDHLRINDDWRNSILSCGSNPYFVAMVVDEDGRRIKPPKL